MRVVLDSSVLFAAHITRAGVCNELLEDVLMQHQLVVSQYLFDELARKLTTKFRFPATSVRTIVKFLGRVAIKVVPADLPAGVCRDEEDIPILGTAVAGEASSLITVDRDLFQPTEFQGIAIIKPGEFWRRAAPQ